MGTTRQQAERRRRYEQRRRFFIVLLIVAFVLCAHAVSTIDTYGIAASMEKFGVGAIMGFKALTAEI